MMAKIAMSPRQSREPAAPAGRRASATTALVVAALMVGSAAPVSGVHGDPPSAADEVPTVSPDELTVGQKGWGETVFAGSTPERFEVEVVGIMRNVAPGTSFILGKLSGRGLEDSGVAAGMSGSPVYFDGRLAGAVSFGWPFSNEPIAGITPIAAMRRIPSAGAPAGGGAPAAAARGAGVPGGLGLSWSDLVGARPPADLMARELARWKPATFGGASPGLQWTFSGAGPEAEARLARWLGPLAPAGEAAAGGPHTPVPGGAVGAVLVEGDMRLAAIGTVTDVDGESVLAFGHSFLGHGPISVPMATAEVVTVLSSLQSSFKISNLGRIVGAFEQDRPAGIRGRLGAQAPMVPMRLVVRGAAEEIPREYKLRLAAMPQLAPTLVAMTSMAALDAASRANGLQGLDLAARFRLSDGGELTISQSFDGADAAPETAAYLLAFAAFLLQNDLAEVGLAEIEVELAQFDAPRTATLAALHAGRTRVLPGERVALHLELVPYRGVPTRRTIEVELPADLPAGRYSLLVGDGPSMDGARLAIERTEPINLRQALTLLSSLHSRRELVVLGVSSRAGLAVAGEALPDLPGSVRRLWKADGEGVTPLTLAIEQRLSVPVEVPVSGALRVDLEVVRREPVAGGIPAATGDAEGPAPAAETGGFGAAGAVELTTIPAPAGGRNG